MAKEIQELDKSSPDGTSNLIDTMLRNMVSAGLDVDSNVTYTTHELSAVASIQRQFKAHKLRREIDARAAATKKAANAGR
eukprot:g5124.t1